MHLDRGIMAPQPAPSGGDGRRYLWPVTRCGRWAVGFLIAFALLMGIFELLVAVGLRGGATFLSNPWLAMSISAAAVAALSGGAAALVAIFTQRERSLPVAFTLFVAAVVALFIAGEIVTPH